ncbi:hypothetical protein LTR85_008378 [Meristemomyces frigidus]|nr:hypothetical protein LTR85_008378 [Meristemomyces frigidus]
MASTSPADADDDTALQSMGRHFDAKTDEKPTKRSLLDLPAELWIEIGKQSIRDEAPAHRYHSRMHAPKKHGSAAVQPVITLVCKIMRAELLPYHYQHCFALTIGSEPSMASWDLLGNWLIAIGPVNRRYLNDVVLLVSRDGDVDSMIEDLWYEWGTASGLYFDIGEEVWEGEEKGSGGRLGDFRAYGRDLFRGESAYQVTFT